MKYDAKDPVALARRCMWLAYRASNPMGMGYLHATDKAQDADNEA